MGWLPVALAAGPLLPAAMASDVALGGLGLNTLFTSALLHSLHGLNEVGVVWECSVSLAFKASFPV